MINGMLKGIKSVSRLSRALLVTALMAVTFAIPWPVSAQSARTGIRNNQSAPPSHAQTSHSEPSDPNQVMAAAQAALKRQDYAGALADLEPLSKAYPAVSAVWFDLAYAHTGLHQNEAAVSAYERTIKIDPKLYQARLNLGILFMVMKRPAEAVPQLKEAVALRPGDASARLYLGRAEALTGGAGAEEDLQTALRLNPRSGEAWLNLGQLDFSKGNFAAARDAFEKAAQAEPDLAQAKLGAGASLERLKQYRLAAPYLEQYLALRPSDVTTRFNLAVVEMNSGLYSDALANLKEIQSQNPSFSGLDGAFGSLYSLLGKYPESEKYYRLALAKNPPSPGLSRELGETLMREKNFTAAEEEFRVALKRDAGDREAANGLAASLYFQKRYADAIPVLLRIIQSPPAKPENYFLLAGSYDHLHDTRPAIAGYQQFLSVSKGKEPDQEWQAQQRIKLLKHELER